LASGEFELPDISFMRVSRLARVAIPLLCDPRGASLLNEVAQGGNAP
jgi:hypothetical protein